MARENIRDCLGVDEAQAEQIARESVYRFGRMLIEVLKYPLITKDNFRQLVHFEGLENLEKAYAEGKGVVMCTAHYGNWEMLGASMALLAIPSCPSPGNRTTGPWINSSTTTGRWWGSM